MNAHSFRFLLPLSELSMYVVEVFVLFAFPLYGLTKRQKVCYTIYARFHCRRFSPSIFHMPAEKFSSAELKHNFRIGPHGMKAMMWRVMQLACAHTHTHIHRAAYPVTHTNICCLYCWHEHKLLRTHSKLAACQLVKIFEYIPHIQHILLYPLLPYIYPLSTCSACLYIAMSSPRNALFICPARTRSQSAFNHFIFFLFVLFCWFKCENDVRRRCGRNRLLKPDPNYLQQRPSQLLSVCSRSRNPSCSCSPSCNCSRIVAALSLKHNDKR